MTRRLDDERRIEEILREIEKSIGRDLLLDDDEREMLVNDCLDEPLSDDPEEANLQVHQVLLNLGILKGDE